MSLLIKHHSTLEQDAAILLKAARVRPETQRRRDALITNMRTIVQQCAQTDDEQWDVEAVNPFLDKAPLELMVVDRKRPDGIPPEHGNDLIPSLYNPDKLASLLIECGFEGSSLPQPTTPIPQFPRDQTKTPCSESPTLTYPWPSYEFPYSSEATFPPTLFSTDDGLPFCISPASPLHKMQSQVLSGLDEIEGVAGVAGDLVGLVWLWMTSHGVTSTQLELKTVVWMVFSFLRHQKFIPDMFNTDAQAREPNDGPLEKLNVWVRHEPPQPKESVEHHHHITEPIYEELKIEYVTKKKRSKGARFIPSAAVLFHFFHSWLTGHPVAPPHLALLNMAEHAPHPGPSSVSAYSMQTGYDYFSCVMSVREGGLVRRTEVPVESGVLEKGAANIERQERRKFANKHAAWTGEVFQYEADETGKQTDWFAIHAVIVRDPVLLHYNHARTISRETWFHIAYHSSRTAKALGSGSPLVNVFGNLNGTLCSGDGTFGSPSRSLNGANHAARLDIEKAIIAYHERNTATAATVQKRRYVVQKINQIVQARFGKKYHVTVFGSTKYGVDTEKSDLDLVILDPDRMLGAEPDVFLKFPDIYNTRRLADVLRNQDFKDIVAVPFASVPIVKFHDPNTSLQGDINVNHQLGWFNTQLLSAYCDLYPNLRVLVRAVKRWAKSLGLNEPSPKGAGQQTSFSSYALTLMVIVFLQVKGILPNLQADLPSFDPTARTGLFWLANKRNEGGNTACDVRFRVPDGWQAPVMDEESSLGNLFIEWFRFWGWNVDYARMQASIKHGGFLPRSKGGSEVAELAHGLGRVSFKPSGAIPSHTDIDSDVDDQGMGSRATGWKSHLVDVKSLGKEEYSAWRRKMDAAEQREVWRMMKAANLPLPKPAAAALQASEALNELIAAADRETAEAEQMVLDANGAAEAKDTIEEMESVDGREGEVNEDEDGLSVNAHDIPYDQESDDDPIPPAHRPTSSAHFHQPVASSSMPATQCISHPSRIPQNSARGRDQGQKKRKGQSPSPPTAIDPSIHVDSSDPTVLASRWPVSAIVVIDPFIMSKNVTRGVKPMVLKMFKNECRRAGALIDGIGAGFEDLFGDGKAIGTATPEKLEKRKADKEIKKAAKKAKEEKRKVEAAERARAEAQSLELAQEMQAPPFRPQFQPQPPPPIQPPFQSPFQPPFQIPSQFPFPPPFQHHSQLPFQSNLQHPFQTPLQHQFPPPNWSPYPYPYPYPMHSNGQGMPAHPHPNMSQVHPPWQLPPHANTIFPPTPLYPADSGYDTGPGTAPASVPLWQPPSSPGIWLSAPPQPQNSQRKGRKRQ